MDELVWALEQLIRATEDDPASVSLGTAIEDAVMILEQYRERYGKNSS